MPPVLLDSRCTSGKYSLLIDLRVSRSASVYDRSFIEWVCAPPRIEAIAVSMASIISVAVSIAINKKSPEDHMDLRAISTYCRVTGAEWIKM
jgi:hypothetical protein